MEDDEGILKKWCDEEELDYSLAIEFKKKIFPLLDIAHKIWGGIISIKNFGNIVEEET